MIKNWFYWFLAFFIFWFGSLVAFADLSVPETHIRFDPVEGIVGKPVTLYVSVHNSSSEQNLTGVIKFFDELEGTHIGQDQSVSVIAGQKDTIFTEFIPTIPGEHSIAARVIPWDESTDNPENNKLTRFFFVDNDTDGDEIGDKKDDDDDGDGVKDIEDVFPLDKNEWADNDGDGVGNNADTDDDNDSTSDVADAFPLDSTETSDLDQDGIGDNADTDDDGDGLSDDVEASTIGTDPHKCDTDGDEVCDSEDAFPFDAAKTYDTDRDGIEDESDPDADSDGVSNAQDAFPYDTTEAADGDHDGIGNNADQDDDNDGLPDDRELELLTDPLRPDTDSDGLADGDDALPLDSTEQQDSDRDGLGDNADTNDTNKGPALKISISADHVEKGEKVIFDATGSYDQDGGGLFYEWHFPDGGLRNGAKTEYAFHKSGKRQIELIITDTAGESRSEFITVTIAQGQWERFLWIFIAILVVASLVTPMKKSREQNTSD